MSLIRVAGGLTMLLLATPASAQTVRLSDNGTTRVENLGRAFETFSVFGGVPGIAAAFYYSDFELNSYQLPIAHRFAPIETGPLAGVSPYVELTLGYLTADQTFALDSSPNGPRSVRLSFDSYSALAGFGADVPLGRGLTLRPIVLAGYAHFGSDAAFAGPNAALVQQAVAGILDRAGLDTALLGGALELLYDTSFRGDLTLEATLRYNEVAAIVTGATNPGLKQDDSFGVASGGAEMSGPTGWRLDGRPVRWLGYARGTWLPQTDAGTLGFNAFTELGGGVKILAPEILRGVSGATARASAILGPGVTGWLVSAALTF